MPENFEEPWKIGLMDAAMKMTSLTVTSSRYWDAVPSTYELSVSVLKETDFLLGYINQIILM
jgi:hypothetical protein